jgi:hypothetical protein
MIAPNSPTASIVTSLAAIVAAVLSVLVALGKLSASDAASLQTSIIGGIGALVALGIVIWKAIPHTDANKLVAASAVPGVTVTVDPGAPQALKDVAADKSNAVKLAA